MKAYVVNLARSTERRSYMERILSEYPQLDVEFIEAVDGRELSDIDRERLFNSPKFERDTLMEVLPGEIGCTLSHQKCYRKLINSGEKYIMILEDDIIINYVINQLLEELEKLLDNDDPILILLSGWFWYGKQTTIVDNLKYADVKDGYLTHAYILNRAAAQIMIDERPWYVADRWDMFRKRGLKIYGIIPHPIDQDWGVSGFSSEIVRSRSKSNQNRILSYLKLKLRMLHQRTYSIMGHFEQPDNLNIRLKNN